MEISIANNKSCVDEIVDIHLATFEGFFLTFLGKGFLKQLYTGYIQHADSGIIVAYEDKKIIGFIAYSKDISNFYKYLIKNKLVKFAWYAFIAFLKNPKALFRLLSAFKKADEIKEEEHFIELSSIGVNPTSKNSGIGSGLINYLVNEVNNNVYDFIKLETDVCNNEGANYFYQKNGFFLSHSFVTSQGREMNEYRYYLNSK